MVQLCATRKACSTSYKSSRMHQGFNIFLLSTIFLSQPNFQLLSLTSICPITDKGRSGKKKVWYIRCTCSYPSVNFLQFCKADLNEPHKKMWGSKLLNFWDICQASFCVQQLVHWKWNDWINRLHVAMEQTQCNDCTLYNDCITWVGADCVYGCYAMVCHAMYFKYQWPWICIL